MGNFLSMYRHLHKGTFLAAPWRKDPLRLGHLCRRPVPHTQGQTQKTYWLPWAIHAVWSQQPPFLGNRWMYGCAVSYTCSEATCSRGSATKLQGKVASGCCCQNKSPSPVVGIVQEPSHCSARLQADHAAIEYSAAAP